MAQKLKFGNGTWATKEGSTLAYNDENNNYKPLPFTTTRDSIGTRVNKQGLIEVVGNDIPRIDYTDSADGVLLLEPSRTNLITYSEAFDNAYWSISRIESPYIADVLSPDGTLNAFTLEISSGQTAGGGVYKTGISITGDNSFSIFAKKKTANYLALGDTGLTNNAVYFDLENGVVGTTYNATGEIQDFGNGWYRCTMKYTLTSSGAKFIYLSNIDGETNNAVQGGDSIYIYGAQLEQGSYATSYIPTSGSTATRQADTANGSGNSEVFNSQEGILFAEVASLSNPPSSETAISISEGTSGANRLLIRQKTNGTIGLVLRVANSTQASFDTDTVNTLLNFKLAAKYKVNDIALWINGFEVGTDTSASVFASDTINQMNFNQGNNSNHFYGKTKELGYYDTALTDEELEYLTSYRSLNELVTELNLNTL